MMGMMCVVIIKTTQQYFFLIGFVISICISIQHEIGTLRYIYSFSSNLKSNWQVKTVGKRDLFVCFSVCICVFENNELIVWFLISGFIMRIAWHYRNPQSAFIVKCQLNRLGQVRKFLFRCKQIYFISWRNM